MEVRDGRDDVTVVNHRNTNRGKSVRNRGMILAAAAAAMAAGALGVDSVQSDREVRSNQARTGSQSNVPGAPQRSGVRALLDFASNLGYGGDDDMRRYRNRRGYTGAEARRRATKTRNRLRARGHHRDAVR